MKNILVLVVVVGLAWFGHAQYKSQTDAAGQDAIGVASNPEPRAGADAAASPSFQCDGRTMCSQMRSCAEATYFIQHCPNTKMDGNNDGVPCERQWCN